MREETTFRSLTSDMATEQHDGDLSLLANLSLADGALRPVGIAAGESLATLPTGSRLIGTHSVDGHTHIIASSQDADGHWRCLWTDGDNGGAAVVIAESRQSIDAVATAGACLTLCGDGQPLHFLWTGTGYEAMRPDDLCYDITVSQTDETLVTVATAMPTGRLATIAPSRLHAILEQSVDGLLARRGDTLHKHVSFGIAAARLYDGTLTHYSTLFALLPSRLTYDAEVDEEARLMRQALPLHRHYAEATPRHAASATVRHMLRSIDIFLTPPTPLLDVESLIVDYDDEGRATALHFAPETTQGALHAMQSLPFYHSVSITPEQWGSKIPIPRASIHGETADLSDLRRWSPDGRYVFGYDRRIHVTSAARRLHSPFAVGVRYHYPTAPSGGGDAPLLGGALPDTLGQTDGTVADAVLTVGLTDAPGHTVRFAGRVHYPIAGPLMAPWDAADQCALHVRLETPEGIRCYVCSHPLTRPDGLGYGAAAYRPGALPHATARAASLSLFYQQARAVTWSASGAVVNHLLWEEESEADFLREASQAEESALLSSSPGDICSSAPSNPLVYPALSHTRIDSAVMAVSPNTRRSADGQFGDSQYYLFTSHGVWSLKMGTRGTWSAHQALAHDHLIAPHAWAATDQAVAYLSQRGLLLLRGTVSEALPTPLPPCRPHTEALPHLADILREAGVPTSMADGAWPDVRSADTHLVYDAARHRLLLYAASVPLALVGDLSSGTWYTVAWPYDSVVGDGHHLWAIVDDGTTCTLTLLEWSATPHPAVLCTQPLALRRRHKPKRCRRLHVTGTASSVCTVLYGSNDRRHWHLVAASRGRDLSLWQSTPWLWHRVVVAGMVAPCESIESIVCRII